MTERQRAIAAILAGAVLAALMLWGTAGLPPVGSYAGPYGDILNNASPLERQSQNVVTAINFDYRGIDTLGEEYILFAAVAAAALLLRRLRSEGERRPASHVTGSRDALHAWGVAVTGCTLLFGVYMSVHATTSPGGGFQGGCILASAWLVVFLTGGLGLLRRVTAERWVQLTEAVGAGAYAGVGLATLLMGGAFLQNLLPLDQAGSLLSGGTIVVINAAVALEVTAGFVLILLEFLRQTEQLREIG